MSACARYFRIAFSTLAAAALVASAAAAEIAPRSADLMETGPLQNRWLSLPMSRLVVNPNDFQWAKTPVEQTTGLSAPVAVGYYAAGFAYRVNGLLTLCQLRPGRRAMAREVETVWMPHALPASASYDDGTTAVITDWLYDENTLARLVDGVSSGSWTVAGAYRDEKPVWDAARGVVTVEGTTFTYAVAVHDPAAVERFGYYKDWESFTVASASLAEAPENGYWSLDLPGTATLHSYVGFATALEGVETAVARALAPRGQDVREALAARERGWDEMLAQVPHPTNFEISAVPAEGVTPQAVRLAYYKAWQFLAATSLPVMPESGFAYPQIACGKPSMWLEGHPLSRPSASWESFFGMQLWGFVEPGLAWDAYRGMMSLVDEEGRLGGESLPSRKAQTAMVLYHQMPNREWLAEVYPAVSRYLVWRRQNPRWIHKDNDFPMLMDSEFVVSAIMDMKFAGEMAAVLGMPEESARWERERRDFFCSYERWFWNEPGGLAHEMYDLGTGKRGAGTPQWVACGLRMDLVTSGVLLESLVDRVRREHRPELPFYGHNLIKYPELENIVHGLVDRGTPEMVTLARELYDSTLRDIVRTGVLAEVYGGEGRGAQAKPAAQGVRPSIFGAAIVIDFVWLKNGVRFDNGRLERVKVPGETSGQLAVGSGQ